MEFIVDRQSPVPVRQQLKGMFEYAIACGELAAGDALPSVREMATRLGVAPMTVSQVYQDLKKQGLVAARSGSGTRVADHPHASFAARAEVLALHRRIDALIDEAATIGIRPPDLVAMLNARLVVRGGAGRRSCVVMIGLFRDATASYARFIAHRLGDGATVEPMTVDDLETDPDARARAAAADLAVTVMSMHAGVAALLAGTRTVALRFIPSEETRRQLASIDPMAHVGLVSRFAEFLPIMRAGVQRFAPHAEDVAACSLGEPAMAPLLRHADVVIFSTGAESVRDHLGPETVAFEYRHTPDPADIERILVPALRVTPFNEILMGEAS